MDALDGAGGGQRLLRISAAGFGGREREDGAKPLAAGEKRVAHGLVNGRGLDALARQPAVQGFVDERLALPEICFQGHGGAEIRASGPRR